MGRRAKGDRHKIVSSMPPTAADHVKAEATALGCYIGDYLGWLVTTKVGIPMDPPIGEVREHPDPAPTNDGRARYSAMVPRAAADEVVEMADAVGTTMGDIVAGLVSEHFGVPFTVRVKKKALRARQMAGEAGEQLPMTG
ncbi:hypothetical protein [Nocardioides sp. Root140]|uniref:hypothetical protein n=1 Tax=Nocardioides sp. Root140 TaxID=1736460 RepID=UPI0006FEFC11|nr:hypothetical protein [Nocardioides sp. Root140]KQY49587.1 hypothetical protein ASD30_22820 [Nocardioides sp. Root140]